jgi:hypothetical protein
MAKRTIGSRSVSPHRTPTITRAEVDEFKEMGRKVTDRGDNIVLVDGFRKFRIVGQKNQEEEPREERRAMLDTTGFEGGNELTDFPSGRPSLTGGRNELTDFT